MLQINLVRSGGGSIYILYTKGYRVYSEVWLILIYFIYTTKKQEVICESGGSYGFLICSKIGKHVLFCDGILVKVGVWFISPKV